MLLECECAYRGAIDAPGNGWLWGAFSFTNQDFMLAVFTALLVQLFDYWSTCNRELALKIHLKEKNDFSRLHFIHGHN